MRRRLLLRLDPRGDRVDGPCGELSPKADLGEPRCVVARDDAAVLLVVDDQVGTRISSTSASRTLVSRQRSMTLEVSTMPSRLPAGDAPPRRRRTRRCCSGPRTRRESGERLQGRWRRDSWGGSVPPWLPIAVCSLKVGEYKSRQRGPVSRVLSPGVTRGDGHFSRTPVARRLQRPYPRAPRGPRFTWPCGQDRSPIGPCSEWGLPSRRGHPRRW